MARKFTEARVPHGMSLDVLDAESQMQLARELGVSDASQLSKRLADPSFVRERIARLPPLCLIMLEVLIESGGAVLVGPWFTETVQRANVPVDILQSAVLKLFGTRLLVGAYTGNTLQRVAVFADAGDALHDLLTGVSLPNVAPPLDVSATPSAARHTRDAIALCALAAHRKVRFTQSGILDRSALKRLTKDLGITLDDAETLLVQAHALGYFIEQRDRAVPNAAALIAADQRISPNSPAARYADQIAEQSWTSIEALARRNAAPAALNTMLRRAGSEGFARTLRAEPSLEVIEHAAHAWVRRRAPARPFGDGHVTPNFQVLLGPAAALGTVARVGLCCELTRLDHVLTLKLTPESVAAGLATGLPAEELRAGLAAVSPHGLPDNVRIMLEDWIGAARFVRLQQGIFLFTDEQTAERVAAELRKEIMDRPMPGVLQLLPGFTSAQLDKALAKAKAVMHADATGATQTRTRRVAHAPAAPNLPAPPTPDADFQRAVLRARETGDYGVDAACEAALDPLVELARVARQQGAPKELFELLDAIAAFHRTALPALQDWVARHRPAQQQRARIALEMPIVVLPWLVLTDALRARVLKHAPSLEALLQHAQLAMRQPHAMRSGGPRAIELIRRPAVLKAIERASALLASEVQDADLPATSDLPNALVEAFAGEELSDEDSSDEDLTDEELDHAILHAYDERSAPTVQRAHKERDAALDRQPHAGTLVTKQPAGVRQLLAGATQAEQIVHVQFANGRVHSVLAEALRRRGRDEVLHCIDLEQVEARVIKLSEIAAAQLDNG
jgi:hypothetical protein